MSKPATTTTVVTKPAPLAHISARPIEGKPGTFDTSREDRIRAAFKIIHHETLLGLGECGIPVQFSDNFFKCGTNDLKVCHQQARALLEEAEKARWTTYSVALLAGLTPLFQAAQAAAREDKAAYDKLSPRMQAMCPWSNVVEIPVKDLTAAWGEGVESAQILADLDKLCKGSPIKVGNRSGKGDKSTFEDFYLSLPFEAVAPVVAEVKETAPVSGEVKANAA